MARGVRLGKVHMRCCRERCKKRFKGREGDPCPSCGNRAKVDAWAAKKEWRRHTCSCNGLAYTPEKDFTAHRKGSRGCVHEQGELQHAELPGDGREYPF